MSIEETIEQAVARGVERALKMLKSEDRLVDRDGAARMLGCTPSTIDKMRAAGQIRVVRNERDGVKRPPPKYSVRELENWIAANQRVETE